MKKIIILFLLNFFFLIKINAQCLKDSTYKVESNQAVKSQVNLQLDPIFNYLNIKSEVGFYDDSFSPNAFAQCGCNYPNCDGIVRMGNNFAQMEYSSFGITGLYGVIAHEAAHVLQCRKGDIFSGMFKELHADFIAGWVLAKIGKLNNQNRILALGESLWDKGDYQFSHGTPNQRKTAVLLGVEAAEYENSVNAVYYNARDWFEDYLPSRGKVKFLAKTAKCNINNENISLNIEVNKTDSTIQVTNHFIYGNFTLKMQKGNPYIYHSKAKDLKQNDKSNVIDVYLTNDKYLLVCINSDIVERWYYQP